MDEIVKLIKMLEQFDDKHGYRMSYGKVSEKLLPVVDHIASHGKEALPYLHELINYEETWSCLFALVALKHIGDPKSISYLINFLHRTNDSNYWEAGEEAMYALNKIGKPAINPLIIEVKKMISQKKYNTYIVGSLTEIKDEEVYKYMYFILEDYANNLDKYRGWFSIDSWCFDFVEQGNKSVLPLLKNVLSMPHLTHHERIELKDTMEKLEDEKGWLKRFNESIQRFKVKIGRNEKCPCGSGKKYKKCCLKKEVEKI